MLYNGLEFVLLTQADISILTPITKRAFDDDARLFSNKTKDGPAGYDDGSFLEKYILDNRFHAYRINLNHKAIGAVIVSIDKEKNNGHLDCLFIDNTLINHGYGYITWCFIENNYPQIRIWETETPAVSYRNHCFYINKCGFHVVRVEGNHDRYQARFILQKTMKKQCVSSFD